MQAQTPDPPEPDEDAGEYVVLGAYEGLLVLPELVLLAAGPTGVGLGTATGA
jgi:hypothetical protein